VLTLNTVTSINQTDANSYVMSVNLANGVNGTNDARRWAASNIAFTNVLDLSASASQFVFDVTAGTTPFKIDIVDANGKRITVRGISGRDVLTRTLLESAAASEG